LAWGSGGSGGGIVWTGMVFCFDCFFKKKKEKKSEKEDLDPVFY